MSDNLIRTPDADSRAKRLAKPRSSEPNYSSKAHTADIIDAFSGGSDRPSKMHAMAPRVAAPRSVTPAAMEERGDLPLEERGVRELRRRARQLHIHNRSKMNKHELIAAIRHALR